MNEFETKRLKGSLIFYNEDEAFQLLKDMDYVLDSYGTLTVADIHTLRNTGCANDYNLKYGWMSLEGFVVQDGPDNTYIISTPPPFLVDDGTDKMVTHPDHYQTKTGLEAIQVIEAFTDGLNGIEAVDTGNVIKYICRWKKKNGLQDLKKARCYLNHLIDHVEKEIE